MNCDTADPYARALLHKEQNLNIATPTLQTSLFKYQYFGFCRLRSRISGYRLKWKLATILMVLSANYQEPATK